MNKYPSNQQIREWECLAQNMNLSAAMSQQSTVDIARFVAHKAAEFATSQERERCAKLCESIGESNAQYRALYAPELTIEDCVTAIRALPNGDRKWK
jgi:hypothetical protein